MSKSIPYVDHCPEGDTGFQSQARNAQADGCAPGFVPPRCKTMQRITHVSTTAALETIELGPFQPLQLLALVDAASTAGTLITDLRVNGESLFTKFKSDSGDAVANGLGDVADLTFEAIRSGANPLPPTPMVDQNNQLEIDAVFGAIGDALDLFSYWGNPIE